MMSSSSEALFDHKADFLKFISSAQSFWFLLDTSYNHGCHLASQFHLDPNEYEALLVRMSDCCLQGIQPCECKGEEHRWVGNQVFR